MDGILLYQYAESNSLTYIDPVGLLCDEPDGPRNVKGERNWQRKLPKGDDPQEIQRKRDKLREKAKKAKGKERTRLLKAALEEDKKLKNIKQQGGKTSKPHKPKPPKPKKEDDNPPPNDDCGPANDCPGGHPLNTGEGFLPPKPAPPPMTEQERALAELEVASIRYMTNKQFEDYLRTRSGHPVLGGILIPEVGIPFPGGPTPVRAPIPVRVIVPVY